MRIFLMALLAAFTIRTAGAHDTWVETNSNVVRTGDSITIDLKLGNHGNDHRDFKLASKVDAQYCTLSVHAPDGTSYDLKQRLIDTGYTPTEGFWRARFVGTRPGLHLVEHTADQVISYAPVRSIKSGKTCFVLSDKLDAVPETNSGFDKEFGHALEIVPRTNPVTPMGPGKEIAIEVLFRGKPLAGTKVSFIPEGRSLKEGFDEQYERTTDEQGRASFEPREATTYLIVAHQADELAAGEGFKSTTYSATLTVIVPAICPCCRE